MIGGEVLSKPELSNVMTVRELNRLFRISHDAFGKDGSTGNEKPHLGPRLRLDVKFSQNTNGTHYYIGSKF